MNFPIDFESIERLKPTKEKRRKARSQWNIFH
jgi:hypothetical protein